MKKLLAIVTLAISISVSLTQEARAWGGLAGRKCHCGVRTGADNNYLWDLFLPQNAMRLAQRYDSANGFLTGQWDFDVCYPRTQSGNFRAWKAPAYYGPDSFKSRDSDYVETPWAIGRWYQTRGFDNGAVDFASTPSNAPGYYDRPQLPPPEGF